MKTNLEILNEISVKLEGQGNATSITEALNNIANALGDDNPDKIISVSNSLEDILSVAGEGGGGGSFYNKKISVTVVNNLSNTMLTWECGYFISENKYVTTTTIEIPANSQKVQDLMIPMSDDTYYFNLPMVNHGNTVSASNLVNCTFNYDGQNQDLVVTDPTMDASVTLTYSRL